MKFFLAIFCAVLMAVSAADVCYKNVEEACSSTPPRDENLINCNAKYGNILNPDSSLESDLQAYANSHIETNFNFLIMSSYFGNYEANRDGFKSLYRKLSDDAWEKSIDIIKYLAKRGGKMNFGQESHLKKSVKEQHIYELSEISSLARGLDMTKKLAEESLRIHSNSLLHGKQDASVGHYLEEKFIEPQADTVRELSGYTTELKKLLRGKNKEKDASLSLYLFDQYLKKLM